MASKELVTQVKLQVPAGSANPAPPVGPALGQHGLNIQDFCKQFNDRTKDNEKGLALPVIINVYKDRSFDFVIKSTPASILLKKAAGIQKGSPTPQSNKVGKVTKKQLEDARAKGAAGKFFAGSVDAYSVGASEKIGAAKNAIIRAMGDNDGDAELDIAGAFLKPVGIRRKLRGLLSGKEIFNRAYAGAGLAGPRNMKGAKEALGNADLSKLDIPINRHLF